MAKFYRARQDVSVPRVVSKTGEGEDATYETEGVNYAAGSLIRDSDMHPRDAARAEGGELDHILEPIDENQVRQIGTGGGGEPEFGIFIAEHEAEAHALEMYGHTVVPPDQALEAQSASAEHHRAYQEAVKEHGLDRRPAQEYFARERDRVPDEVLFGGEHRAGTPHNRGPAEQQGVEQAEDDGERQSPEMASASRPAPGVGQQSQDQSDEGETGASSEPSYSENQPVTGQSE